MQHALRCTNNAGGHCQGSDSCSCCLTQVGGPTPEASELQVQLLSSLLHKVLLKLGLAALRQAAAAARLRTRLLAHAAAIADVGMRRAVVLAWKEAAIPSEQQAAAGAALAQTLHARRQHAQYLAWREWAAHSAWQRQQLAVARGRLRRQLMAAALQHWRCYCQQQLVRRLQAALAARWLAAWSRRRAFVAWRRAARRSVQLKAALLLGRPCSSSSGDASLAAAGGQQGASQAEVLQATARAFEPVKVFVAEARQQLGQLRQGLRFSMPGSRAAAGMPGDLPAQRLRRAPIEQEPLLVGSVESLLAHLPPSRLPKPAAAPQPTTAEHQVPGWLQPPGIFAHGAAARAAAAAGVASEPAPDPGSPPPHYNPGSYASPQRQQSSRQQQQRRQQGQVAALADTARFADPPEAAQAELLECQEQVQRLRRELEDLEQARLGCASSSFINLTVHPCLLPYEAQPTCPFNCRSRRPCSGSAPSWKWQRKPGSRLLSGCTRPARGRQQTRRRQQRRCMQLCSSRRQRMPTVPSPSSSCAGGSRRARRLLRPQRVLVLQRMLWPSGRP